MTTTTSTPTARPERIRPSARVRGGRIVLTVLLALAALVAVSTAFSDDPFPEPAIVLVATFGVLAAVFGLLVIWSIPLRGTSWLAIWALPLFFVVHVAALGTWIPDAVLAVVAAVGVLLVHAGRG